MQRAGNPRLAILLAMAMFVLVVDTSLMNVSISAVVRIGACRRHHAGRALTQPYQHGHGMMRLPDPVSSSSSEGTVLG